MRDLTAYQELALGEIEKATKAHPVTGADIVDSIGLRDADRSKIGASMRAVIHALRVKGFPICASSDGYWWPSSERELEEYCASLDGRISEQQRALDGLRAGRDKVGGVMKLAPTEPIEIPEIPDSHIFTYTATDTDGITKLFHVMKINVPQFLKDFPDAIQKI